MPSLEREFKFLQAVATGCSRANQWPKALALGAPQGRGQPVLLELKERFGAVILFLYFFLSFFLFLLHTFS